MRKLFLTLVVLALAIFGLVYSPPAVADDYQDALNYLKSSKSTDRSFAIATLGLIGPNAVAASKQIVGGLLDDSPAVRQAARVALPQVNPTISGPVLAVVQGQTPQDRMAGVQELSKLGVNGAAAIPALLSYLQQAPAADKVAIATSLATVGAKDPELPQLLANMALQDQDPGVRAAALLALPKLPGKGSAVDIFTNALNTSRDGALRAAAINGLLLTAAQGNPDAIAVLKGVQKNDPNPQLREMAKQALGKIEKDDKKDDKKK